LSHFASLMCAASHREPGTNPIKFLQISCDSVVF
jgi:hypothetical protein